MMKHYLDYNATAPLRPQVLAVMQELQGLALNPSSAHAAGRKAKSIVEDARRVIGETVGAFANEVVFTASGTEANNWVLHAFAQHKLLVSAIEHSSVLKTAQAVTSSIIIPVNKDGIVDLAALERLLPKDGNFLVSVMLANNETGVIQPVQEVAALVHARGGLMHCDAVQGLGKIPVDFTALGCDFMTIAAHKMGGPVGVAALVVRSNLVLPPMLIGGGQELNRRAGTENVTVIAGFAKAAELIDFAHMVKLRGWLDAMEVSLSGSLSIGKNAPRLPNTSCIIMPGVAAETQLINFDLEGIAVSAGSACSSGRIEPSHVLKAMGMSDTQATTAIRISGGWAALPEDIMAFGSAWVKLARLKNAS